MLYGPRTEIGQIDPTAIEGATAAISHCAEEFGDFHPAKRTGSWVVNSISPELDGFFSNADAASEQMRGKLQSGRKDHAL